MLISSIFFVLLFAFMVAAMGFSIDAIVYDVMNKELVDLRFNAAFLGIETAFVLVVSYILVNDYAIIIRKKINNNNNNNDSNREEEKGKTEESV